jgi:hypothetical protein
MRTTTLTICAAAATLAVAAPAAAFTVKDVHRSGSLPIPSQVTKSCPQGTHIVSGGAVTKNARLTLTKRQGNGWIAGADPFGLGARLAVHAYCSKRNLHLQTAKSSIVISDPDGTGANCPGGTNLISGGGSITSGALFEVAPNEGEGGWFAEGSDNGGSATVTAITYCTPEHFHLDWHKLAAGPGQHTVTAPCAPNEAVISGGGGVNAGFIASTSAHTSLSGSGWRVGTTLAEGDGIGAEAGCF